MNFSLLSSLASLLKTIFEVCYFSYAMYVPMLIASKYSVVDVISSIPMKKSIYISVLSQDPETANRCCKSIVDMLPNSAKSAFVYFKDGRYIIDVLVDNYEVSKKVIRSCIHQVNIQEDQNIASLLKAKGICQHDFDIVIMYVMSIVLMLYLRSVTKTSSRRGPWSKVLLCFIGVTLNAILLSRFSSQSSRAFIISNWLAFLIIVAITYVMDNIIIFLNKSHSEWNKEEYKSF